MRRLIIDTATEALSVALIDDDTLVDCHYEVVGRGHAEKLIPVLAALEGGGRAGEIVADAGPGSFTGVRVGLSAARALAFAWGVGLRIYSSLALLAAMAREDEACAGDDAICIVMTGGHGELFWQKFDRMTLSPLTDLASTPIAALAGSIDGDTFFGSGAETLVTARGAGRSVPLLADARYARLLPQSLIGPDAPPLYGRGADAVVPQA